MKKHLLSVFFVFITFLTSILAQCPPPGFPPPGDICSIAPTLCDDINGYCATLSNNNTPSSFPGCPANALNNDDWFSFIAGSTNITIEVVPTNCQGSGQGGGTGMQGAMYEGSCTGPAVATQCTCTSSTFNLSYTNFIVGSAYYIVFDGCGGDICDFQVNVISGSTLPSPPADPGPVSGPTTACPGGTTAYSVPNPNAATYNWTITPANIGTVIPGGGTSSNASVNWNLTGTAMLCVTASNPCFNNPTQSCITVVSTAIPATHEYEAICLGECTVCAGTQFCGATPAAGTPVTLNSWQGCDSVVYCHISTVPVISTNLMQQTFCAPHTYQVCTQSYTSSGIYSVVCENWQGCDSTVLVDLAIFDPDANVSPPAVLGCGTGASVVLTGINSTFPGVPNGNFAFQWTGPGIVPPSNQVTCTVNAPGQYCLTLTHSRGGVICTDSECVTVTQNSAVPAAPQVSGPQTPCQNSTQTYTVTPVGAVTATGYTWTAPNNVTVTQTSPTTVSINWNSALGGNLCVTANNGCGSSPQTCIPITIGLLPANPLMTGPTTVCSNNITQTYTVSNPQTGVTYNWTVPAGASFSGSGASITVNYSGAAAGSGQVCVTAQNACGTSQATCVAVTITPLPVTPVMSGPTAVCSGSATNAYTVSNPQTGVTYNWTAPPGATITGTGASVNVNYTGATSGQVCVSATNSCGTSTQTCQNVTVTAAPSANISGAGTFCQGTTPNVNLTITLNGTGPWNLGYAINSGATILINNIATSPYTLNATQAGTYTLVSLSTGGGCPGTVNGSATIIQNPSPTAALSGSGSICMGSGQQASLSITLTGAAPWTVGWAVGGAPQANLNITSSPFNLNIGQAQAGNITLTSVIDANNCNGTVSGSGTVTVNSSPTVSNIQTPCNGTNTSFTVSFAINGGSPASYSVTPATGTLTGNVFTSNPIPTGSGYSFVVTDANNCSPVTVSEASVICDCETAVGTINISPLNVCGNGPVAPAYNNSGQMLDANDALVFILHSGNGLSIVPPVLGTFPTSSFSFNPATMAYGTTYYLSAVVGDDNGAGGVVLNDPCLAVAQGTPITFFAIPSATLSGNTEVCDGDPANLTVNFTGEGPWTISYNDSSGVQTVNGITDNPFNLVVNPAANSTYSLTDMSDVHCDGNANGSANVTVNTGVSVNNIDVTCNPTSTAFTVTFEISGGEPATYIVTGATGNIVGGVFTSNPLPAGSGFNITVSDANDCDPQTVQQTTVICNCLTDAGDMSDAPVVVCGDGPETVAVATGTELDADDLLQYVLHELSSNTLGPLTYVNGTPTFTFNPANMTYGTTYYISSVIGSVDLGTGGINLGDPCLSIAPGTPIVFYEVPTATLTGGQEICPGEDAILMFELSGDSPWELTLNGQSVTGIVGTPFSYTVSPATTTTYTLSAVSDEHCDNSAVGAETVTVHTPPTAGAPDVDCNATGTGFTVCFDITGGDPACLQVLPAGTITGNQFCSNILPDGQGYAFSVSDCHGCPAVVVEDVIVDCSCLTSAGNMNATPIEICGSGSAMGIYPPNQALEVLDGDDAVCFILHAGNPNLPIATSPTPSFSFNSGIMTLGTQYFICPIVGNNDGGGCVDLNDPCLSVGGCVPVTFNASPTAVLSGTTDICSGENASLTVILTGVAPWLVTYQSAAGAPLMVTANVSPFNFNVNPAASTVFNLVSLTDANCVGTVSGNAIVSVNEPPQVANETRICDPTGTSYMVTFDIIGGDATSYSVTPSGNISGGVFMSNPIPSGTPYSFSVDDVNGCGPTVISGNKNCDCNTDAGDMANLPSSFCVNENGTVASTTGEVFDANDVLMYVLHTNPGSGLGTVIATNSTPSFNFNDVTMDAGVQYYISAVAGDNNGSGNVDLLDDCLSIAPGTPIIFVELPTASVSGTTTICEGQDAAFTVNLTGTGPYELTYLLNAVTNTVPVPVNTFSVNQPWLNTTTVTLVSLTDLGSGCANTSAQTATITVNPSVEAGTATGNFDFCQNQGTTINLASQLSGADTGGNWTGSGGVPVNGNALDANALGVGTNVFTYTMDGIAPCPDDQVTVDVVINAAPVADAGGDKLINCDVAEAGLGGAGTTPGLSYEWSPATVLDANASQTTTTIPGTYTLLVSGAGQCTATDEITVEQLVTVPIPHITITDVSCFGRGDGFIVVDSITNGQPPYLYSFDGSPFVAQSQFLNLEPGEHTLIIVDDGGCETTLNFDVAEPVEVTVQIQGSFEGNEPVVEFDTPITIEVITNPPFEQLDTIIWMPDSLLLCPTCPSNEVSLLGETTFSVMVEKDGCRDDDKLTVYVKKTRPVFVPNAFSPNEDGTNEKLNIFGGKTVSNIKSFLVFNRWGETVFEFYNFSPNDQTIGWDGKHRGQFVNPAVFTWFAEVEFVDGLVEMFEGSVNLIR